MDRSSTGTLTGEIAPSRGTTPRDGASTLDRLQEVEDRLPLAVGQALELGRGRRSLAVVQVDRVLDLLRTPVVQEPRFGAYAPERGGAHHARSGRPGRDPVAERSHVMQQEVAERVEGLIGEDVVQARGDGDAPAGRRNEGGGVRGGRDALDVAAAAPGLVEERVPRLGGVALAESRRRRQSPHEVGEAV